jgi:hypothetical protein
MMLGKLKIRLWGVLFLLLLFVAGWQIPVAAQEIDPALNRAGLVVVHEDGTTISRCVGFVEEQISGYELLVRGEFAPRADATSIGTSICSLEGKGCGEGENCFCQCQSSPCIYWTYWQGEADGWSYAGIGAGNTLVGDGDVEGWVWGESRPNAPGEIAPPPLAFADICTADAVIYGVGEVSTAEPGVSSATSYAINAPLWMVALIVGVPLLLGAGWWLSQARKRV